MSAAVPDSPDRALVSAMAETMARTGGPYEWDADTLAAWVAYYEPYARALLDGPLAPLLARAAEAEAAVERCRALLALWMAWDGSDGGFATSSQVRDALAAAMAGDEVTWLGRDRKLHRAALSSRGDAVSRDRDLEELRREADRADEALLLYVIDLCPAGSGHLVIQHRDTKPPWCRSCGRDNRGVCYRPEDTP